MKNVLLRSAMALCLALLLAPPAFAQLSGPAVTTANVNLREGPGARHAIVRVLRPGEELTIARCASNWCLVDAGRDRGWVAQPYLRRLIARPDVGFRARACFYERPHFRGASFCLLPGQSEGNLGAWRDRIASVAIEGRSVAVELCFGRNFRDCTMLVTDVPTMPRRLQDAVTSVKVW